MMPRVRQPWPRGGRATVLFAFVVLFLSASTISAAETRLALVIGNGAYREVPLNNPPNDARLIGETLKRLGFTVIGANLGEPLINADQKAMKQAIRSFGEQLSRVGSDGVGLFFYAGHAVQANGKNYLIPVGADIRGEADLEDDAVSADSVLARMSYAGTRVNLVILDACRNNPYRGKFRSATGGGLVEMSAPRGSLVAYSTAPGDVAEDGNGKNSPYSAALAEAMALADVPIELAFKRVRTEVMQATGDGQVPWESSSLIGDFYFVAPPAQQLAANFPATTKASLPQQPPESGKHTFDGWYYSHEFRYGFRIKENRGMATVSNSTKYNPGDVILRFTISGPKLLIGEQICTDGKFYPVTGTLSPDGALDMTIEGCGSRPWRMVRTQDEYQPPPLHQPPPSCGGGILVKLESDRWAEFQLAGNSFSWIFPHDSACLHVYSDKNTKQQRVCPGETHQADINKKIWFVADYPTDNVCFIGLQFLRYCKNC